MPTIEQALRDSFDLGESKQVKVYDNNGLYLLVNKSGKYWRYDYKYGGKRKTLSLGVYPKVKLRGYVTKGKEYVFGARESLENAKALIIQGFDPSQKKQESKAKLRSEMQKIEKIKVKNVNTFSRITLEWITMKNKSWSSTHALRVKGRLKNHVLPLLGELPVANITRQQISEVILTISNRGLYDTAKRVAQYIRLILEYACDRGLIEFIPMGNVKSIIPSHSPTPMPALKNDKEISTLLKDIESYNGSFVIQQALRLLPFVFLRAGEFRLAEWSEINIKKSTWTIPAAHRKIDSELKKDEDNYHIVPLSRQAVVLLRGLYEYTGTGRYLFPSLNAKKCMSENSINKALESLGYKGRMVGHGWRSIFSTKMNEQGFNPDAIERQLSHVERNKVRGAYNRAEYLDIRIELMQSWADYLDYLKKG